MSKDVCSSQMDLTWPCFPKYFVRVLGLFRCYYLKGKFHTILSKKNGFLTKFYLVWRENQLNMCLLRTFGHSLFKKSEIPGKNASKNVVFQIREALCLVFKH